MIQIAIYLIYLCHIFIDIVQGIVCCIPNPAVTTDQTYPRSTSKPLLLNGASAVTSPLETKMFRVMMILYLNDTGVAETEGQLI